MINFEIIKKAYKKAKIDYIRAKEKNSSEQELSDLRDKADTFLAVLRLIGVEK